MCNEKQQSVPAESVKFCYQCGAHFDWDGGPDRYCGACGAVQPYSARWLEHQTGTA